MSEHNLLTRRVFLKRAGAAFGVFAFLPALTTAASDRKRLTTHYYEHTILAMGTTARLGLYARDERTANAIITKAFTELKRLESLFTIFDSTSEISRINTASGEQAVEIGIDTLALLQLAKEYSHATHGAFDCTVGPLMKLWGFRNENQLDHFPTEQELHTALALTGSEKIILDPARSTAALSQRGMSIDLGGIAVGYALDRMKAILQQEGITQAFLDISGDIIAIGHPQQDTRGWEIGIPDPADTAKIIYSLHLKDRALATSGNYMNYVVYQAKHYGHIMDLTNGYPVARMLSSTAIGSRGIEVDALSTASFVSGKKEVDTKYQGTEFILVHSDHSLTSC